MDGVRAVLIDIDGVLTVSWKPLPGAVAAIEALRRADLPFALVTNTTSRTRARIAETLVDAGFPVGPDDVLGAPAATAAHLREHHPGAACLLLSSGDVADDLDGVRLVGPDADDVDDVVLGAPAATAAHLREHHPGAACLLLSSGDVADDLDGVRLVGPDADDVDVVVLGGAGPEFSYEALDTVYRHLQHDAALVAMHRNLYWRTDAGLQLDAGAFLLGLEKAADVEAVVLGKPSGAFFAAALSTLGVGRSEAVMVGDDLEADVLGAQRAGIASVLVRTGKFTEKDEEGIDDDRPQHVVDSIADLPGLLGLS
jgi:HAD superfamily hydrolase (TIGR01450 family)